MNITTCVGVAVCGQSSCMNMPSYYMYACNIFFLYLKSFCELCYNVGMAVPKTTETRCRDGSVQA